VTGEAAAVARRHRRQLAELFRDEFGWQVSIDDRGAVRSLSQPGAAHRPRGLSTRSGKPFDPQRYALLFLVLATLEATGARVTLSDLFDEVALRAVNVEELVFDRNQASHRRRFVQAVQALVRLDVLTILDQEGGSEDAFAAGAQANALYRVDRIRLERILATSKPPSLASSVDAAVAELYSDTEEGRTRRRRHRITRALVSEPVVYRSDLDEAEVAYLVGQEARIRRLLAERFGLTLETRAEGWVAVDTEGGLTDQQFPAITVPRAAGLAIVDASRDRRRADGAARWSIEDLRSFVAGLAARFGASWTLDANDADAVARVTDDAVDALVAMGLAAVDDGTVVILPAAGRFSMAAADEPTVTDVELELT
jgi:uncharacterized protein (TIGR02678 family)